MLSMNIEFTSSLEYLRLQTFYISSKYARILEDYYLIFLPRFASVLKDNDKVQMFSQIP